MQLQFADRINKLPPYLFADLRKKIADAKSRGINVISLGIGDPDQPTPDPIVQELVRAVTDSTDNSRFRYGCDVPVAELSQEFRNFYQRRYNVNLAADQVVATCGSKDAIVQFCMGLLNPGDLGIAPEPGYPTYSIGHTFASACTYRVPLRASNKWLLDFDEIPAEVARLAKVLWINYPNNPTTAVADLDFFQRAVDFGRKHNIIIAHDSAYSENTYGGYKAPSILQVPGADEVAVEFFSLSKAFNMTGWRVGFVAGNSQVVKAVSLVKDNSDNGTFRPVQMAAVKALQVAESLFPQVNAIYEKRRDMVVAACRDAGWQVSTPQATIYIWAPIPEKYRTSAEFAADLLEKAGVVITPGRGYGEAGEGFYRISLTYPDHILAEALERIRKLAKT